MASREDPYVVLETGGSSAKIHLFGATVTSWMCHGEENLFMSSLSKLDGSKAVRGGIPIVFPNFGPWKVGPQHGFARSMWWKLDQPPHTLENGQVAAVFELKDTEESRAMWDHQFVLKYKVSLSSSELRCELTVTNSGTLSFSFTTLLHTYFNLSHVAQCRVTGLQGCTFVDKVKNSGEEEIESRDSIVIDENVDNIYKNTAATHTVADGKHRTVTIHKNNLPDTVLWNPWVDKAAKMGDFDDEGYKRMVCVEAGFVGERKLLQPDLTFTCSQTLTSVVSKI